MTPSLRSFSQRDQEEPFGDDDGISKQQLGEEAPVSGTEEGHQLSAGCCTSWQNWQGSSGWADLHKIQLP